MAKKRIEREVTHMPHYDDVRGVSACGRKQSEVKMVARDVRPTCNHCKPHWNEFEYRHMRRKAA